MTAEPGDLCGQTPAWSLPGWTRGMSPHSGHWSGDQKEFTLADDVTCY